MMTMELSTVPKWERDIVMPKSAKILKDKSSVGERLSLSGKILLAVSPILSTIVALSAVRSALILWPTNFVSMAATLFIGTMALTVVPGIAMLVGGKILEKRDSRKADDSKKKRASLEKSNDYAKQHSVVAPDGLLSENFGQSIKKDTVPSLESVKLEVSSFKR